MSMSEIDKIAIAEKIKKRNLLSQMCHMSLEFYKTHQKTQTELRFSFKHF